MTNEETKDGAVEAPGVDDSAEESRQAKPAIIKCRECGEYFERTGGVAQKICRKCKPARKVTYGKRAKERKGAASSAYTSTVTIKPKAAKAILRDERGITNPRILDVCVQHALYASQALKIPYNVSLFAKGLQGTLQASRGEEPEDFPEAQWFAGERVTERDLHAMFDYVASWRTQPDGTPFTYAAWKAMRRRSITDLVWFANVVLNKSFMEEPHGRWARELFPQLEPALLSLPEKFTEADIAKAFYLISDVRQRCLIAARSSYKSTVSTAFMLQVALAFAGSVRIMVVTATQPLAKGFAKALRSLVTLRDPVNATMMNILWPEHCLDGPDDGKQQEYTSPFRQLDSLIEPTFGILSVISEGAAGMRYDLCTLDDVAEISNSSTPEMRAKTQERVDMLRELGSPHSLTNYVGTPISPGAGTQEDPGDLYSVLLMREERNQKDGGSPKLLYAVCPAWTVNPGVKKVAWSKDLLPTDVTLLFPSRLSFKYLMEKLKENLATDPKAKIFRQQALVNWVPDIEEDWKVTFDRFDLDERVRPASYFAEHTSSATRILGMDRAYSTSKFADRSALLLANKQLVRQKDGSYRQALVFSACRVDRWRESDLIRNICEMIVEHQPQIFVAEMDKNWQEIWDAVRSFCVNRGVIAPHFRWRPIVTTDRAFARRAKMMEAAWSDGRIWVVDADWTEGFLKEFEQFDGRRSTSARKDDQVAAASLIHQECGVKYVEETKPEDLEKQRESAEEEYKRAARQHFHDRMMGGNSTRLDPKPSAPSVPVSQWQQQQRGYTPPEPTAPAPVYRPRPIGGGSYAALPRGMRGLPRKP